MPTAPGHHARAIALAFTLALGPSAAAQDPSTPAAQPAERPTSWVEPRIGSGGFGYAHGSAFPGAAAPHGLVKAGPDTTGRFGTVRFLHFSGYWYGDDTILGFSHLHLHGTGAPDYGVLAVMPSVGIEAVPDPYADRSSKYRKKTEVATPGGYAVTLDRGDIRVELAATPRAAHHRYTFPAGAGGARLFFDLDHHLEGGEVTDAELVLDPGSHAVRGRLHCVGGLSRGFGGYDLYFAAHTRAPWTGHWTWSADAPPSDAARAAGRRVGCALAFDVADGAPVELALAVSFVDAEGAARNLAAELPDWDFEGVRRRTADRWNGRLESARVTGGSAEDRRVFASALYRCFLMPTIASDVDGRYRGFDGRVHVAADGFPHLTDFSLWDTYRTLHPLYALLAPESARDSVRSLCRMAQESGRFPQWPLAGGDSGCMIGASAEIVLADAWGKGVTGFDARGAYALLRAAALDPAPPPGGRGGRSHVEGYDARGYVEARHEGSVSLTTEFAHDDFALAQLAAALGEADDARRLLARSKGYRKLYDPATGFLRGRDAAGALASGPFDPWELGRDYVEANAWHSLWAPGAHDPEGLAELLGGPEALVTKLEAFFERTAAEADAVRRDPLRRGLPRSGYWHGNEPDIHAAYLFAQVGRPDRTQRWVDWVRRVWYGARPDGLAGNDDGGTLSAWYVFSALGFYPVPGSDRYVIGTPLFPQAEIRVPGGTITIRAPAVSERNVYVQSARLNGRPLETPELRHADLAAGGTLEFDMGPEPGKWGRK